MVVLSVVAAARAKDARQLNIVRQPTAIAPAVRDFSNVDSVVAARRESMANGVGSARKDVAQKDGVPHPQRLLVRFQATATQADIAASHVRAFASRVLTSYPAQPGLVLIEAPVGELDTALLQYQSDPKVLYAEPDYAVSLHGVPNDPFFVEQWGLRNVGGDTDPTSGIDLGTPGADIRATDAWEIWTGDPSFRIAVIDSGLNYTHPDLAANAWTNPLEIAGNGIDDDRNGWIDDVHGYNFVSDHGDPRDDNGHGSHVSGILGAVGNDGIGIAGVNWQCQIVALKAFNSAGQGFTSDIIKAINYAVASGIKISNNSWASTAPFSQALYDAIANAHAHGHLFVAAAGNLFARDIDAHPVYPASFDLPNILSVANSDNDDRLGFISNVGKQSIDLAAPGVYILSTDLGSSYFFRTGTSMATPHVTGAAALLWSRRPELTWWQVKDRLLATVRPSDSLRNLTLTGGVLDAAAAVGDCNTNRVPDELEISAGDADDCNADGIPDECQADCNENLVLDDCEITAGTAPDCNANGAPDSCDIGSASSNDCNGNAVPDECDLSTGTSADLNDSGAPDECETCQSHEDCDDHNPCTDDTCTLNLCFWSFSAETCDDADSCTEHDQCDAGVCVGSLIPTLECAPTFSLKATKRNGEFLANGRESEVTVSRGDRLTLELTLEDWSPEIILAYNAVIDPPSFRSGDTGIISPLRTPDPGAGAFIDEDRTDFLLFGGPTFSLVFHDSLSFYQYLSIALLDAECATDTGREAYLGTLVLDVGANASGTFQFCLREDNDSFTFLLDCLDSTHLPPDNISCVTIHVPLSEEDCATGTDCNGNGRWDVCDIVEATSMDCNDNDIPDSCDFDSGLSLDCNANGLPDECDISERRSVDCDRNGEPDECQPDCNDNGVADPCDIKFHSSFDCNENEVPDECDLANGTDVDCNENGVPDGCEPDCNLNQIADPCDIQSGTSLDRDGNTVPDECQETRHVPDDYDTIQAAIDQAEDGDLVMLADGTYQGEGNMRLDLQGKILTLTSQNGPEHTTIELEPGDFAVHVQRGEDSNTRIVDLTMTGGLYAIVVSGESSPEIRNCWMINNRNAGVIMSPGSPLIEDCVISGTSPGRGVICLRGSDAIIRNCIIQGDGIGGIFAQQSSPTVEGCLITAHANGGFGTGLRLVAGTVTMKNCTITENAGPFGSVMHLFNSNGSIESSIIWDNRITIERSDDCSAADCPPPLIVVADGSRLRVASSDIENGMDAVRLDETSDLRWSEDNISVDPSFASPADGCYPRCLDGISARLAGDSPCLDYTPVPPSTVPLSKDLDGHARVLCDARDLGAFEHGLGDPSCDRRISLDDVEWWLDCVSGPGSPSVGGSCHALDYEFDRDVDLVDFARWQVQFGSSP